MAYRSNYRVPKGFVKIADGVYERLAKIRAKVKPKKKKTKRKNETKK